MELKTISQVSKAFNVSTRTLRYYEQIGLLHCQKKEEYAYRTYDEDSIKRLQQIIILRKLRIPLKQISDILKNEDVVLAVEVFYKNIQEIDDEINALSTIKSVLNAFINQINRSISVNVKLDLLGDKSIIKIIETLTITKINFKGGKSMESNKIISKLRDKDVRIIYLPPATIASIHCFGGHGAAEINSGNLLHQFIEETKLYKIKPDFRHYGFNNPKPDGSDCGYERWVTIPEDFYIKPPFVKKHFSGGLYCAIMIPMGEFDEWFKLCDWAKNNDKYELDFKSEKTETECLEEHLNYINKFMGTPNDDTLQLDLLLPIKPKNN